MNDWPVYKIVSEVNKARIEAGLSRLLVQVGRRRASGWGIFRIPRMVQQTPMDS